MQALGKLYYCTPGTTAGATDHLRVTAISFRKRCLVLQDVDVGGTLRSAGFASATGWGRHRHGIKLRHLAECLEGPTTGSNYESISRLTAISRTGLNSAEGGTVAGMRDEHFPGREGRCGERIIDLMIPTRSVLSPAPLALENPIHFTHGAFRRCWEESPRLQATPASRLAP